MKISPVTASRSAAPALQFEVRTISDRLVDVIRDMILAGEIEVGVPIRQDALASQLKVSKIPLREALARLEQDGLVVSHPNRGFFLRPLSAGEAEEVYALRLRLEPDATAAAALEATEEERAAAVRALDLLDQGASAHEPTVGALNRAFHLALVTPCKKRLTTEIVTRLNVMADRYVGKHLEPQGRHVRAEEEHQKILDAWMARDADAVRDLVRRHIECTLSDLRVELDQAEG